MERDELLIAFAEAFGALDGIGNAVKVFGLIEAMHTEKYRRYHNLNHVVHCLEELNSIDLRSLHTDEMKIAIFMHDLVYNPFSSSNERASALIAHGMFSGQTRTRISDMILVTGDHSRAMTLEERYLADIDYSILGSAPDIYRKYSEAIRAEYFFFGKQEYRAGRKAVLMSFLKMESLYLTKTFAGRYEKQARQNIENEIAALQAL